MKLKMINIRLVYKMNQIQNDYLIQRLINMLKDGKNSLVLMIIFAFFLLEVCQCLMTNNNLEIPQAEDCQNYYTEENMTNCDNKTCILQNGFNGYVEHQDEQKQFLVCLNIPQYQIFVNPNYTLLFEQVSSVFINCLSITIMSGYQLESPKGLYIIANKSAQFYQSKLYSYKIWIYADSIYLDNSSIINESLLETNCNCAGRKEYCQNWSFRFPYLFEKRNGIQETFNITNLSAQLTYSKSPSNSVTLTALSTINITNYSVVRISVIGIFATNISFNISSIDTSGLGYGSSYGPGCGYFDQVLHQLLNCMGTGGSHGGFGGNSSPQNCYLLLSKPPYGSVEFPYAPGSGGGFFIPQSKQSSSGGGIINIQCEIIFMNSTLIYSEGKNGVQGGGGGAGGAISVEIMNLTTTNTTISANGGNGQKSSSGSGGRVRIVNHNWKIQEQQANIYGMSVSANGGALCPRRLSCGENGSIFTSPCRPGYQLTKSSFICKKCQKGYYQLTYGYSNCIPCSQNPENSHFEPANNNSISYQSACSFVCNDGYYNYTKSSCQTLSQRALDLIGGSNMIISICIIMGAIIIFCLVMLFKKLSQNQQFSLNQSNFSDSLLQKRYFRMEDIPFHQLRLYIDGTNSPFDEWRISEAGERNFYAQIKNPVTKINNVIAKAISEINSISKYSKFQKSLVLCLKYSYYPLSRLVVGAMKRKRAQAIFSTTQDINKKIPDFQNLGIKFNMKPQMTVCSLQIFNYTKSVLDFYIENYYPLFFLLEKAPFGGYEVDFSDPFLRVFINEISERDSSEGKSIEGFLRQVNRYLKNPNEIISLLNYLWSLRQIFPHLQAYLWQPPNRILGINKEYSLDKKKPLFLMINSENINNRHFIFSEQLPCIHYNDIQCLKHKFIIRKQAVILQSRSTIWIVQNSYSQNTLLAVLGVLSVVSLLLAMSSFFLIIYMSRQFIFGVLIYFILWPLCDFAVVVLNFKTILIKNEYMLAYSIYFNLTTIIKLIILFFCSMIEAINDSSKKEIVSIMYIWLIQLILAILIFIDQVMLRAQIIAYK